MRGEKECESEMRCEVRVRDSIDILAAAHFFRSVQDQYDDYSVNAEKTSVREPGICSGWESRSNGTSWMPESLPILKGACF